ncbi:preprotein translocase subunit YajC [Maridesulfovibrio hydrothermalis]|uniref:Sec translocon accessory complex subunit YajC n=1 Tax=Maridesulfovibrio hydrothermalis AM13 = DSM 14728 TaxID=1121451 RepID=L0RDL8_9BACT|nr:preprotein translocase subunit YajC [Maridesulfovibrio hydrothermalis]CCO24317.1 SecYEG protein translocase auxillary subunit [Maridesulfovibrio hydrothermalis AM13 = DSM 14728]
MFFADIAHAMGATGQQAQGGPMGALGSFLPLILMFAIFYFLLIRPQQKKAKQHKEMLAGVQRGDRILTGGGLYGRVMSVDGDELTVELAEGVQVKLDRGYVANLVNPVKEEKKEEKKGK